jgi:signal transduction histidine kinase
MLHDVPQSLAWKREAIGRLASGLVHSLNNRLQDLVGNMEMAADELPPGSPGRACAEQAIEAAMRAAEVADSVLTFAHGSDVGLAPTDLGPLLIEAHQLLTRTASSSTAITLAAGPPLPPVMVDADALRTLLVHLALDASLALRRGGVVRLSARVAAAEVTIGIHRQGEPAQAPIPDTLARVHAFAPDAGAVVRTVPDGVEIGVRVV